jgi:hypothetical protein
MPQLTSEGQQKITALAQRYGVSTEAVLTLLQALVHGHGTMGQFDHPELGGGSGCQVVHGEGYVQSGPESDRQWPVYRTRRAPRRFPPRAGGARAQSHLRIASCDTITPRMNSRSSTSRWLRRKRKYS